MVAETMTAIAPSVLWAQRKNAVFITIAVSDLQNQEVDIQKDKVTFAAEGSDGKKYAVELNLFGNIDVENSKKTITGLHTELNLVKEEEGPYWPRLLKEKGKFHYLKVNFAKWVDEDDDNSDNDDGDTNDMGGMGGMPGMGMGGMGGMPPGMMGGMGGMPGGMSGMGGMPGMGGAGGMDMAKLQEMLKSMGGAGGGADFGDMMGGADMGDDGDDDDDDLPPLE